MELRRIGMLNCLIIVVIAFPQLQPTEYNMQIAEETKNNSALEVQINNTPKMEIREIKLDDQEQENILGLNTAISQQINQSERKGRAQANLGLTHDDITKLFNMITSPRLNAEPRRPKSTRNARVLDQGYLVFAIADVDENNSLKSTNFKKLHIVPANSQLMGAGAQLSRSVDDKEEGRFFKMKTINKYVRRLMRMIRKGTWKVTKATFFRSAETDTKTPVGSNFPELYLKQASELQPIIL